MPANLSLDFNNIFLSSLNENGGITDGRIALPVMLEMNVLMQSGKTPTKFE